MKKIAVNSEHQYEVEIGCEWEHSLLTFLKKRSRVAIIFSEKMPNIEESIKGNPDFSAIDSEISFFSIPDGESAKTEATLKIVWDWLGAAGFTRSDLIVGIGGGTVTDFAGFIAATWLRGMDWVAIPTTLAGMVDAAIGGKTGINSEYGKNLIGAFHSPIHVLVDLSWLETLSNRDFAAGMAEVVKCGFIEDSKILELARERSILELRGDQASIEELVSRAVSIKARVVSSDFKEGFEREILNYGHTLGHAIELHSNYSLRHGEAISIGMVFVAELACQKGILSNEEVEIHRNLLSALELPISYPAEAWSALYRNLLLDKKVRGKSVRFVAISEIGKTLRLEDLSEDELLSAYEKISS